MSAVMPEKVLVTDLKNGVKVRAEWPHLVSFGGGRLSTAVTILPLKEGLTTVGSSTDCDIIATGTGVQRDHCRIHNDDGIVILSPTNDTCAVTVDGVPIERPITLSQGCMVCIGRSNYFRFNHPEQAAQLRNILPANSRFSVVPLQFAGELRSGSLPQSTSAALDNHSSSSTTDADLGHAKACNTTDDESFSSKLRRFEELTSSDGKRRGDSYQFSSTAATGGSSSSNGNTVGELRTQACRPSDLTTNRPDSGKPAYLSYIGEKLFGQCISGSAPYPNGSSETAAVEDFYRERSGSASSSDSSSSSGSSTSSSSNSSGEGSFLEGGRRGEATCGVAGRSSSSNSSGKVGLPGAAQVQSDGGKRATATAATTNASASAVAAATSSASDDLCLQQGQLPLLRHRLGRGGGSGSGSGGGRTPSCDIKTLSMMSTETSVWGSTSSLATVEAPANDNDDVDVDDVDYDEGGVTPSALTPVGRRTFEQLGTSDTVFGNGFADDGDNVDASEVICRDSFRQATARGLPHEQSEIRRAIPFRLPSTAVSADAVETMAGPKEGTPPSDSQLLKQQHKHSRSVELRRLAEEAERRERRRLDEVLLMCAEYDLRAATAAATAAAAAADNGSDEPLHLRQPQLQLADLPALMPLRLGTASGTTTTASTSATAAARIPSSDAAMAVKTSSNGSTKEASAERFQPPHQHDQRLNVVPAMVAETVAPTATGKLPDGSGIAPTNVKLAPPSSVRAGGVGAFGAGRSSDLVNGVRPATNGVATPPKSAGSSTFPEGMPVMRLAAPSKCDPYVVPPTPALHDDEHVYDTPPVESNRCAAVAAPGMKTLPPEGPADQSPVAGAGAATAISQQETERIYDDPATYVSFVEPSPPVPMRLTAAAQTLKAKVPEKAPGVHHTAHAAVSESNKSIQDQAQQQQQRARPAVPGSSQQQLPLSTAIVSSSTVGQTGTSTALADATAQLQSLSRSRHQIVELLAALLNRIAEVTKQQETIVRQFELVRTRMAEEQTEEMNNLQSQSVENARLRARQLDALARVTREQEEEAAKVERARARMEALEQRRQLLLAERDKRSTRAAAATDDSSNGPAVNATADYYTSELEQLDCELKDFEDLEFQQLEVEAKFEEEKEEVQGELAKQQSLMMKSISAAEEKLNARIQRQRELLQKARADADAAEYRRQALVAEFRTQKDRLLATDKRMRELDAALQQASHAGYKSRDFYATAALEDDLTWQNPAESNHQMLMLRLKADDGAFSSWRLRLDDVRRAAAVAAGVSSSDATISARLRSPSTVEATTPATAAAAAWPAEHDQPPSQQQQRSSSGTNGCLDSEESSIKSAEALSDMDKTSFSGSDDISDRRLELQQLLMQARAHVENADSGSLPSQTEMTYTSESETSSSYLGQLDMSSLDSASAYGDDVRHRERNITPQDRPLTRYLPARADALDLRCHIEAAGHNVSSCPHVIIDDRSCRGYLLKMGYKMKSWNKRWFVFSRDKKALLYYMDKHDTKPRGVIPFHAIEDVFVDHLKTVKTPHHKPLFCVKTTERPYHMIAKTPETMSIWIDVIFSGAEGYREF